MKDVPYFRIVAVMDTAVVVVGLACTAAAADTCFEDPVQTSAADAAVDNGHEHGKDLEGTQQAVADHTTYFHYCMVPMDSFVLEVIGMAWSVCGTPVAGVDRCIPDEARMEVVHIRSNAALAAAAAEDTKDHYDAHVAEGRSVEDTKR